MVKKPIFLFIPSADRASVWNVWKNNRLCIVAWKADENTKKKWENYKWNEQILYWMLGGLNSIELNWIQIADKRQELNEYKKLQKKIRIKRWLKKGKGITKAKQLKLLLLLFLLILQQHS